MTKMEKSKEEALKEGSVEAQGRLQRPSSNAYSKPHEGTDCTMPLQARSQ